MWVAILIVLLASGDVNTVIAPEPMATKQECVALQAKAEDVVKADKTIKAYALKCVEVVKDDVKANGKDA